jgi:hypothetical protein
MKRPGTGRLVPRRAYQSRLLQWELRTGPATTTDGILLFPANSGPDPDFCVCRERAPRLTSYGLGQRNQRTAKVRRSSTERGDHAVCASQLKGECQENDKSKGPQCHQASCDQSGTIASDQFGHFIPPSFSGKTKGKSAGFRFGRFFHTNLFGADTRKPVSRTINFPNIGVS